jgi:putative ABC transport system permease protein
VTTLVTVSVSFARLLTSNIRRRPYRNIATMLCFAFIASSILSARYLISGTTNSLNVGTARLGADIIAVPAQSVAAGDDVILTGQPTTFLFNDTPAPEIMRIAGVGEASAQIYVASLQASCCSYPVQLIGFNESQDFTISPWLKSELGRPLRQNEVVVGSEVVGAVGTPFAFFYGRQFTVGARLEPTGTGVDTSIFIRMQDVYAMAAESETKALQPLNLKPGQVSAVLVRVRTGFSSEGVAASIKAQIPDTEVITANGLVRKIAGQISLTTQLLYIAAASVILVSFPLIVLVSSMVINEQKREIGILRAMGGTKRFILKLFFAEAITLALIGGIIGVLASFILMYTFQNLIALDLQIPFLWPSIGQTLAEAGLALALVVGVGSLASLYPVVKNSRLEPYEAIRSGES